MARRVQSRWEQVSELVGRIELSVSGKAHTDRNGRAFPAIPETTGFYVEIKYENAAEKMYRALCSSRVAVQDTLKQYFWEHGKFPVQPGKVFKATSNGGMELPNTVHMDRIVAKAASEGLNLDEITRLKAAIALAEAKLAAAAAATQADDEDAADDEDDDTGDEFKYPEGSLDKVGKAKLLILAQDEEVDGYAEMSVEELRNELYIIEK